jgi:hypothetical protein
MRKTGKLYTLTLVSAGLSVFSNIMVALWNDRTSSLDLWLDIIPQGFGMSSLITSTLIAVIATVSKEDMAVATGGTPRCLMYDAGGLCSTPVTYLFRTTGQVLGVSLSGAALQTVLLSKLSERITGPDASAVRLISLT